MNIKLSWQVKTPHWPFIINTNASKNQPPISLVHLLNCSWIEPHLKYINLHLSRDPRSTEKNRELVHGACVKTESMPAWKERTQNVSLDQALVPWSYHDIMFALNSWASIASHGGVGGCVGGNLCFLLWTFFPTILGLMERPYKPRSVTPAQYIATGMTQKHECVLTYTFEWPFICLLKNCTAKKHNENI